MTNTKTGKCIGGPLNGRTVTSETMVIEAPEPNPEYDPIRHGVDMSRGLPTTRDGKGNSVIRAVRYRWDGEAWIAQEG